MLADFAGAVTSPLSASPAEGQRGVAASSSQGLRGLPAAPPPRAPHRLRRSTRAPLCSRDVRAAWRRCCVTASRPHGPSCL